MRIALTADLHWGATSQGDAATRVLARHLAEIQPEVFAIAGDVGEGEEFRRCLSLFEALPGTRLLVPGNHDLWTRDPGVSSLELYEERLPALAAEHGFHYLDLAPYVWAEGGL